MSQKSQYYTAELKGEIRGESKGLVKGEAIGLVKGRSEGEAIGLEKGRSEGEVIGLEKAVIRGHHKGHSIETIASITDLSHEQILKIIEENGNLIDP